MASSFRLKRVIVGCSIGNEQCEGKRERACETWVHCAASKAAAYLIVGGVDLLVGVQGCGLAEMQGIGVGLVLRNPLRRRLGGLAPA
jgi:hypothetical protein